MIKTKLLRDVKEAAKYILNSEVVAFPTETVYGLGANVFDEDAVHKIYILKNRPPDNPLIVHICSKDQIELLASEVNITARHIIDNFFLLAFFSYVLKRLKRRNPYSSAGSNATTVNKKLRDVTGDCK